jgi:hypothetical protein
MIVPALYRIELLNPLLRPIKKIDPQALLRQLQPRPLMLRIPPRSYTLLTILFFLVLVALSTNAASSNDDLYEILGVSRQFTDSIIDLQNNV